MLIFPSKWPEPLSRVLIEASALSVPIAAMNTGGTSDVIEDEETGLLSSSVQELAEDVTRLQTIRGCDRNSARRPGGEQRRCSMRRQWRAASSGCIWMCLPLLGAARPRSRLVPLRVAVLARSVYPLHGYGGLERHVYDLVRHLLAERQRNVDRTTSIAATPCGSHADTVFDHPRLSYRPVPYTTFPFANRRGTTILDRSTAYPLFGLRAGRLAARLVTANEIDVVHGLGASALGYALADRDAARVPLVFNPQGSRNSARPTFARPLKRMGIGRCVWLFAERRGRFGCVIATDRRWSAPSSRISMSGRKP